MKRSFIAGFIMFLISLPAYSGFPGGPIIEPIFLPNALKIEASSLGAGIDHEALNAILVVLGSELAEDRLVKFTSISVGREGEKSVCAEFASVEQMQAAFKLLGGDDNATVLVVGTKAPINISQQQGCE